MSPNYIKGQLPIILQYISLQTGCHFQPLPVWPHQGTICVWMQFAAVLEYACSLAPTWNLEFALTHNVRCVEDPTRALGWLLRSMWLYVRGLKADITWPLISSLLPCCLVPNGTSKMSASLLGVLCWDWLKGGDSGWPCYDMLTDSRTQPPQPGHVACLCMCVTGFWLLDCNVIPLWEKKLI